MIQQTFASNLYIEASNRHTYLNHKFTKSTLSYILTFSISAIYLCGITIKKKKAFKLYGFKLYYKNKVTYS